jgi:hypothetical protein
MATETSLANPSLPLDPKYDNYDFPTTSPTTQSGHPGHTTEEQNAKVYQLRMMLEAKGYKERLDTLTLVRWHHYSDPLGDFCGAGVMFFFSLFTC